MKERAIGAALANALIVLLLVAGLRSGSAFAAEQFSIEATGGAFPIIRGKTTLPDGAPIFISVKTGWLPDGEQRLRAGLSACGDSCWYATGPEGEQLGVPTTVQNGRFTAGPFSRFRKPLAPGIYRLEIFPRVDFSRLPNGADVSKALDRAKTPLTVFDLRVLP